MDRKGKHMLDKETIKMRSEILNILNEKTSCIYHNNHRVCGIYAIFNKVNGKVYIGKTTRKIFSYLRTERLFPLRSGNMHNKALQEDFNKYGEDNFSFFILEKFLIIDNDNPNKEELVQSLNFLEVYYIKKFKTTDKNYGYNIEIGGDNDITLPEIYSIVREEANKRESWAYGDFANTQELPFVIPEKWIPKSTLKFPKESAGLGSVMGLFVKENQNVNSFEDYVEKFFKKYGERPYVQQHRKLVPYLLAQQILKIFPKTRRGN
jgi:group I intron endonuclease